MLPALLLVGTLAMGYALLVEPFMVGITRWDVASARWADREPLKIAILTDIHMIRPWMAPGRLEGIVERTNGLEPDLIVLLGDYVSGHPFGAQVDPYKGLAPLKSLKAPCGVYAVLGNHDLQEKHRQWPAAFKRTGIQLVENTAVPVSCNGGTFWVAGVKYHNPDTKKAMRQVKNGDPVIFILHSPDAFPLVPERAALSMAGHLHGGQIKLPFIGAVKWVLPSDYGKRYLYGHIIEDGRHLIVSSGLGMTGLPLRFLSPPEIALVTLSGESRQEIRKINDPDYELP